MKPTHIAALIGIAGFCAAATFIVVAQFYSYFPPVPTSVAITLWAMAGLCALLAVVVKGRVKDNRIGFDKSQLEPTRAANFLVMGKASAWTGAIFGGGYLGLAIYIIPRISMLTAAGEDTPKVIGALIGGFALSAAGLWLERACQAPPPKDAESA